MRIVFMGTPDFSVPTLEALVSSKHKVEAVVTQPDKPKGRGKSMAYSPVKEKALEHNIEVLQPIRARDTEFINELSKINPDVIVVIAFGQILPKEIIDMPKYGCINIHASLLPKYRGAAPIQWTIIDGEEKTGITTMLMDVGIDTGDMLLQEEVIISKDETGGSLHDKMSDVGAQLLLLTLEKVEQGTLTRIKQDDSKSNYVGMIHKALGKMDFDQPAIKLERLVRGLNPWPSAYTYLDGKVLKIWKARVINKECEGENGEIVEITKDEMIVKTGEKALAIEELQLEGKKRMTTDVFLRGYPVRVGTKLEN